VRVIVIMGRASSVVLGIRVVVMIMLRGCRRLDMQMRVLAFR
jgi:hypothetical protein